MVKINEEIIRELEFCDKICYWSCRCCGHELFRKNEIVCINRRILYVNINYIDWDVKIERSGEQRKFYCARNTYLGETVTQHLSIDRNKLTILY